MAAIKSVAITSGVLTASIGGYVYARRGPEATKNVILGALPMIAVFGAGLMLTPWAALPLDMGTAILQVAPVCTLLSAATDNSAPEQE